MKRLLSLLALVVYCAAAGAATPEALFYIDENKSSADDFLVHSAQVDVVVPTWYQVDETGRVTGKPEARIVERCRAQKIALVPIVTLFNKVKFHALATSEAAQAAMNASLVAEAKANGYKGIQFDFENVSVDDRALLTALVARSAAVLHGAGFQLSIATVPNAPGTAGQGSFSKWMYADWRGAYDLEALARSVDLICLMTYDQHTVLTTPGPVGGWIWTLENLNYALKVVPRNKLSLGIALYGYHWYTDGPRFDAEGKAHAQHAARTVSSARARKLAAQYGGKLQWDDADRSAYTWYYRDQMRDWIYFTDARTFAERYALTKRYRLAGFCSWVLGEEDPAIWKLLPAHTVRTRRSKA
ncbi:MAG: glycosyl hydrolase family 18 protein [Terracidiphilus sp.]|nr:glycosyl hydrolase family 18 protein [Terracidiphilus sp.]